MGSNMAEAHPVGFQWVSRPRHEAPRSSTSTRGSPGRARTPQHVTLRAGTDIAFLGGVINYILTHDLDFREYVRAYTNAPFLLSERYRTRGPGRAVQATTRRPRPTTRRAGPMRARPWTSSRATTSRRCPPLPARRGGPFIEGAAGGIESDPALEHPRCVFRCSSGTSPATPPRWWSGSAVCRRSCSSMCAGPDGELRPGAHHRGVLQRGLTQHSVGAQFIRPDRSSSCCWATSRRPAGSSRCAGHASIQGSTDVPTLFNLLPDTCRCRTPPTRTWPPIWTGSAAGARRGSGAPPTPIWSPCSRSTGATRRRPRTTTASTTCPGSTATTAPTAP
ncbi:hypothetical protein E4K10_29765 [Streptomyces sp. T1317-0309]|nr:hypothetical protein E4K10_29765 [Streptomyces sp. T1317-0309]